MQFDSYYSMENQILRLGTVHRLKKKHLQFCKRYLEVNNKASNIARRAELGRFPLSITITQKPLNYILHIQSKTEDSFTLQW